MPVTPRGDPKLPFFVSALSVSSKARWVFGEALCGLLLYLQALCVGPGVWAALAFQYVASLLLFISRAYLPDVAVMT